MYGIPYSNLARIQITIESFSTAFTLQLTEQFTIGVLRMHVNTQAMFERYILHFFLRNKYIFLGHYS